MNAFVTFINACSNFKWYNSCFVYNLCFRCIQIVKIDLCIQGNLKYLNTSTFKYSVEGQKNLFFSLSARSFFTVMHKPCKSMTDNTVVTGLCICKALPIIPGCQSNLGSWINMHTSVSCFGIWLLDMQNPYLDIISRISQCRSTLDGEIPHIVLWLFIFYYSLAGVLPYVAF